MGVPIGYSCTSPEMVKGSSDIFMKDTDPQQRNELLGGLKNVFVNETEGTCGFHIVNMGWEKYVPVVGSNACNLQK